MGCKINWTTRAWLTYEANIQYLQKEWTAKEVSNFVLATDKKIASLSGHPAIGKSRNKKYPNSDQVIKFHNIVFQQRKIKGRIFRHGDRDQKKFPG